MTDENPAASPARHRRGLTRGEIVDRALEIGDREGLEAVSVRRLAAELGVTSMALYRHVRDKNDLFAAMLEAVMADVDLTEGLSPGMAWQDQVRTALGNGARMLMARPVALPLQIAYEGPLTPGIVRPLEAALGILVEAGFSPPDAVVLARTATLLVAGLLLLYQPQPAGSMGAEQRAAMRRMVELQLLGLPEQTFPIMRRHASVLAESFVPETENWGFDKIVAQTIELIVAGMEARLGRPD